MWASVLRMALVLHPNVVLEGVAVVGGHVDRVSVHGLASFVNVLPLDVVF